MSGRKGFTLIELLVVIAIIAILAAILYPVFTNAKERGRQATCIANLKSLSSATRLYADANAGKMPSAHVGWAAPDWCGCIATDNPNVYVDKGSIWKFTGKSKAIYLCPSDARTAPANISGKRDYAISYSMNYACHLKNVDLAKRPSRVLLYIHEGRSSIDDGTFYWSDDATRNLPAKIHWEGTTASYIDGHAKWLSFKTLKAERSAGWWNP